MKDLGDRAAGYVVDEDQFHLIRPKRTASGTVVGVFPYAPKVVMVQTHQGEKVCVKMP